MSTWSQVKVTDWIKVKGRDPIEVMSISRGGAFNDLYLVKGGDGVSYGFPPGWAVEIVPKPDPVDHDPDHLVTGNDRSNPTG